MIAEAIKEIQALTQRSEKADICQFTTELFDGQTQTYMRLLEPGPHGRKLGGILTPPRPASLSLTTLTGLVDAIKAGAAGDMSKRLVHVEDYLKVAVKSTYSDPFGIRDTLLQATYKPNGAFQFDTYYNDPEKFIIALQAGFYMNDDAVYVQKIASGLVAVQGELSTEDDGFSQKVAIKTGEIRTKEAHIKPRVKLIPRRTFDEAAPVESEFLVRLKADPMSIAIFSVDGTKWQGECMRSIAKWLKENLPAETPIVA